LIVKIIILAAGEGSRLRPLTDNMPKCMVAYNGRPIIEHQLDVIHSLGIKNISIVRGYCPLTINYPDVTYYQNSDFNKTNMVYTLFCAERELEGDDIIISYGDIIYHKSVLSAVMREQASFSVAVDKAFLKLWQQRMENPLDDLETLKYNKKNDIIELGKKAAALDEIQGQYIGLIKIRRQVLEQVKRFYHDLPKDRLYDGKDYNNMYMTSFIQAVIDNLMPVKAVFIHGGWLEIDSPGDLELQPVG